MRSTNIEEEVEKTLHALDSVKKVKASPNFLTRLMQRIDAEQVIETETSSKAKTHD